jgi:hypothetical protein
MGLGWCVGKCVRSVCSAMMRFLWGKLARLTTQFSGSGHGSYIDQPVYRACIHHTDQANPHDNAWRRLSRGARVDSEDEGI